MDEIQLAFGPTERLLARVAEALPSLLMALLVLIVGLVVAFLGRRLAQGVARRLELDALAERMGVARLLYALQVRGGLSVVLANLVWLVLVLLAASTSAEIAGLPGVAEGVGSVVEFLPRLISAGVVALFGFAAAEFASRVAAGFGQRRSDMIAPQFAANLVYYLVLAVVLTTAIQHLGMETRLVDLLIGIVIAAVLGSLALSFAWASRDLLRDVVARPYVAQHLAVGSEVRVGQVTGVIQQLGTLTVTLQIGEEELILPYRAFRTEEGFGIRTDA